MVEQKTPVKLNPRHIFVRPARGDDAAEFTKWILENKHNEFDSRVMSQCVVFCAFNSKRKVMFMPVQRPVFLESIAPNPDASESEKSAAMKAIVQSVVTECYKLGINEVYFLSGEPTAAAFAEHNGFEKVEFPLYRMRVQDLEPRE